MRYSSGSSLPNQKKACPLIIWGASGQAKVLHEFLEPAGFELIALFDNQLDKSSAFPEVPFYRGVSGFREWRKHRGDGHVTGIVAVGASGQARVEIQQLMEQQGVHLIQAVHPTAYVARNAVMGKGCQILSQAVVAAEAQLGEQCIVNTAASVDHETTIGSGVHVAPGARVLGCVVIGDYTFVGAGAVVLPRLKIGRNVMIGAGAIVTKDIPDNVVVYGNPATIRTTISRQDIFKT